MSYLLAKELKRSKYRLLGLVGQGQFGRVYCAIHRKTGRLVALKELDKQRFSTHNFLRELRFLLSLQHVNIVTCHALEHTPTGRYLVMDYCEGGTLRNLMEEDVRLNPVQCLKLVIDLLAGLDHAHSRGIVHCDIKPENILLTLQAGGWTARISDFGIARLQQESSSTQAGATGSPAYMAPERFYGQYSAASDLYAVGVLLFELLAGYRPFSGVPAEMMSAHLNRPVKVPETIPTALRSVILTALQKLPARRFRSAAEMLAAVRSAAEVAQNEFDDGWTDLRLLRSLPVSISSPYQCVRQEALEAEVRQLVLPISEKALTLSLDNKDTCLYQVLRQSVRCQIYPEGILVDDYMQGGVRSLTASVCLSQTIQNLLVRPQGCFAVTRRSIYRLATELFQPEVSQSGQEALSASSKSSVVPHVAPELIAEFSHDIRVTIEPNGRWMAVALLAPDKAATGLSLWKLPRNRGVGSGDRGSLIAEVSCQASHLFHVTMPDSQHIVTFSHVVDKGTKAQITGVLLQVFTRRGHAINSLSLPVPLSYVLSSATPYHLIAMEPGRSQSVMLINLKPLKLWRIGLEIVPILLATSSWGYVLMAADGRIVLLDNYGQGIGQVDGPAHPTAIAIVEPYGLLVATWKDGQGSLCTIDLRQLEVGILF